MGDLLVLHQGAIGDFLLTLPLIQAARGATGASRVTVTASAPSARLAAGRSVVDAWFSPDVLGLHSLFRDDADLDSRFHAALSEARLVLNFLSSPLEPIHPRLKRHTVAPVISLDPRPAPATLVARRHITAQWSEATRTSGLQIIDPSPASIELLLDGPETGRATVRLMIHPGAGGKNKCWPAERFAALAEALLPAEIHWMLGPAELEQEPARFQPVLHRSRLRGEPLCVEPDFARAAATIAGMDLYVGNDAGMTHLAAALGVPTLVIFGPTDPQVWRPLGGHVAIVSPPEPGSMAEVSVEAAITSAKALRRSNPSRRRGNLSGL